MNFSEGMEEKGEIDHYVGVAITKDCPDNLIQLEVPALTWAVFEVVGLFPDTLQNVRGRFYSEWFPSPNYEQVCNLDYGNLHCISFTLKIEKESSQGRQLSFS